MSDGFEPFDEGTAAGEESVPTGIPMARPVELPSVPSGRDKLHTFLLPDITRRGAAVDIVAMVFLLFAAWVIAEIMAGILLGIVIAGPHGTPDFDEESFGRIALLPGLCFRAVGSIIVVAALVAYRRQGTASVGISRSGLLVNGLLGIAAMALSYGLILLWQVLVWLNWPHLAEQADENVRRLLALIPKAHPLTYGAVALVIGLYEELIFRGFLMPRLRRATGSWTVAVIVSSVLFTLPHLLEQTVAVLGPIAILSLVFSLVTVWRRSVIPAVVGHFLFDWSQFLGLYVIGGDTWA